MGGSLATVNASLFGRRSLLLEALIWNCSPQSHYDTFRAMQANHDSESRSPVVTRRQALSALSLTGASAAFLSCATAQKAPARKSSYRYCLNMSTIRGQELSVTEEIEVAGKAGYDAIEPWLGKLNQYVNEGGSLSDLRKQIADYGMTVESAIGFASWAVNDPAKRAKGFADATRDMELLAAIGGKRIAAPPAGVPGNDPVEPDAAAERYHDLLEIGDKIGVIPQIEMWGGHPSIGKVSTAIYIAIRAGHPKACFLGDVYHTYKGGSDFDGFRLLSPQALQVIHMNDYPADPPQDKIRDEHRVYPGDGIAPLNEIFGIFESVGAKPVLSLELFNREYWKMDPLQAAKIGLQKMQASVARAGA